MSILGRRQASFSMELMHGKLERSLDSDEVLPSDS